MPRKILVVGAGQSGLQLAHGLLRHGYEVTVMTARTAREIRDGRVTSTQAMFDTALQHERDLELDFWAEEAPRFEGLRFATGDTDNGVTLEWFGRLDDYGQSVDQRLKMSSWLETFEQRGGNVVVHGVTLSDLDRLIPLYDLTVVAAGKGELVNMFARDASRSLFTTPQRALAVAYVTGVERPAIHPDGPSVQINLLPGLGELFVIPGLTLTGPCDQLFFECVPEGPLDRWADVRAPEAQLTRMLELIEKFVPWEYERVRGAKLTDAGGTLAGRFPPTVRHPVGETPSGNITFGMADVVVANDPITGQGSNNAAKCAAAYLDAIVAHGDAPYDADFMQRAFDVFWEQAQYSTMFTNAMLRPPPPHVLDILGAAARYPEIANRFINGYNDPADLCSWLMDPDAAAAYLAEVAG